MREILYKYNNRGLYETEQSTSFAGENQLKLIVEPHDFSIAIGGEVLRNTSFDGCEAVVSNEGEAVFYDNKGNVIGKADKTDKCYREIRLIWEQGFITVQFGQTDEVDYYPNCDGEHDRWGTEWVSKRSVKLNLNNNSLEIE